MITLHIPGSINWLFSEPKAGSYLRSDQIHRIKIICLGSISSFAGAAEQGLHTVKTFGRYVYSKINPRLSEKPTFSNFLLEAYKVVAYSAGIVALPILGIIINPESIIGLYEKLRLYKTPTQEQTSVQHPQHDKPTQQSSVQQPEIGTPLQPQTVTPPIGGSIKPADQSAQGAPKEEYIPLPLSETYHDLKVKFDGWDSGEQQRVLKINLKGIFLDKKKEIIDALLAYFKVNKDTFNTAEGYHRISGDIASKRELELQIVTSDATSHNLRHKLGTSIESRNLASGILKDLVKSSELFPYHSAAYQQLLALGRNPASMESQAVLNVMEPMKKEILVSLLVHLQAVATFEAQNRMGPRNLAMVFAPNIDSEPDNSASILSSNTVATALTKMIQQVS